SSLRARVTQIRMGSVSFGFMADELHAAEEAIRLAGELVDQAVTQLAHQCAVDGKLSVARLDERQVVAYDLAHAAAALAASRVMLSYAQHGDIESMLARAYIADAIADIVARFIGRDALWGVDPVHLAPAHGFLTAHRAPAFLCELADACVKHGSGPTHLSDDFE